MGLFVLLRIAHNIFVNNWLQLLLVNIIYKKTSQQSHLLPFKATWQIICGHVKSNAGLFIFEPSIECASYLHSYNPALRISL